MSQPQQDYQEIHHQYLVVRRLANIFKEQKKKNKKQKPKPSTKNPMFCRTGLQKQRYENILRKV